jgi:hypothetical protein
VTGSNSSSQSEKETIRATKERVEVAQLFAKGMATSAAVAQPARTMSREDSKSGMASKLKKAGVTLIALPDPITGAVGVPVLAAGFALEKLGNRELKIPQVTADLADTMRELEKLRRSLR